MRIPKISGVFFLIVLSGCHVLMPKTETARQTATYGSPDAAHKAFDTITASTKGDATPESYLRTTLQLGVPYSQESTVGPTRIATVLTGNTGDGALQMLDSEIRTCIALPNASDVCKMTVFSDAFDRRKGVGQNVLARILGIYEKTETSTWSWVMFMVMQYDGKEWKVIHKQFESAQDPSKITKRTLRFFDNFNFNITP